MIMDDHLKTNFPYMVGLARHFQSNWTQFLDLKIRPKIESKSKSSNENFGLAHPNLSYANQLKFLHLFFRNFDELFKSMLTVGKS